MPFFSTLDVTDQSREVTEAFAGYNHNLRSADGEWYETGNITTEYYPVMSQRKKRAIGPTLTNPCGMYAKDALAYIADGKLYWNFQEQTLTGITLPSKNVQILGMGAYLCIFGDDSNSAWTRPVYFNTEKTSEYGYMDQVNEIACNDSTNKATFSICLVDGTSINATASSTAPASPADGQYWIDTSEATHVLKVWSAASSMWNAVPTVYTKINLAGIGTGLSDYDGVTFSGIAGSDQLEALNGTVVVYKVVDANNLIVIGLLDQVSYQTTGTIKAKRDVPDMDFITECGNRLWGCKYGVVGSETVNEIYCCVLGDFKNWRRYLGISTDAWAGSVGTDGVFTGAATHLGYPLFFKENCIHKVYPSATGAHQIVTTNCRGVQRGCSGSLSIVNEVLFYKSCVDVCSYEGSLPASVSGALGDVHYKNAIASSCNDNYIISMQDDQDNWHLFNFNTKQGFWIEEDNTHVKYFAPLDNDLYFITDGCVLESMRGTKPSNTFSDETAVQWKAETGVIGFSAPDKKYLSRFNLRMALGQGSSMDLYLKYDEEPDWVFHGHMEGVDLQTFTLPIRPRRCDHLRMKLEGVGEFKLYSIARIYEQGSDY